MKYALILAVTLAGYWLTLSGYLHEPLILFFGAVSVAFAVGLAARMKILDSETVPYLNTAKTLTYFIWLFREVVKANMAVIKAVLSPELKISPSMIMVPTRQDTDIGRTMFANSITLTPGTVSVDVTEDGILVHALLSEMANPDDFMDMGERSGWSVGESSKSDEAS
ncbi:Na+/H+ antiporter subunit E [Robiginitomaculum antarcticum]|uniref:Na+/H+ antiporter subunit E n=1 Tax=Robiginitomaculum antarcticum TaxID=437507 RepID=UPI0003A7CC46|nr:Na+/H+ antiporter subunit E [Robiginitomaculum antarcticum]